MPVSLKVVRLGQLFGSAEPPPPNTTATPVDLVPFQRRFIDVPCICCCCCCGCLFISLSYFFPFIEAEHDSNDTGVANGKKGPLRDGETSVFLSEYETF